MESQEDFVHRAVNIRGQLRLGVDCDLLVYTPEEFARMRDHGFVKRALETGRVLHAKEPARRG